MIADTAQSSDIEILFLLLAFIAFAAAVYLGFKSQFIAAVVTALIGVIILLFGAS